MKDLKNSIALVTGGSRGLGTYIAHALAREGADVALTARTKEGLEKVADELSTYGVRTLVIPADITDRAAREEVVRRTTGELGPIDLLINNAGIEEIHRFSTLEPEFIEAMVQTNITAPLLLARMILPGMLERRSGHIVNIASLAGKKGSPYSSIYSGTKAALTEWNTGLREELRGSGVSLSAICPGFVSESGMFAALETRAPALLGELDPEDVSEAVIRVIREDIGEVVINPGPIRLMIIANAVSPRFGNWLLRTAGVYDFFRQLAEKNEGARF